MNLFLFVFVALFGFLWGLLFVSILKTLSLKYKILTTKGIPLVGGIGIGLSFILVSLLFFFLYQTLSRELTGILVSATIMLILGVVDDYRELSVATKFLIQIFATFFLVFFGIRTQIINIGIIPNLIITFIWVIAITNAFNLLDVIDGLASGCAIIASFAFFVISFINGDIKIAILCLALTCATSSCLLFNLPPAKIYLGNAGSHFLGFVLAGIALAISYAPLERKLALVSPLLILGFPILDTVFLILMRVKKGKLIFNKSRDHLALRFLHLGYSKNKTLLFMLILSLFFAFSGVLVSQVPNAFSIIIIIAVAIVSLILPRKMSRVSVDG